MKGLTVTAVAVNDGGCVSGDGMSDLLVCSVKLKKENMVSHGTVHVHVHVCAPRCVWYAI